MSHAYDVQGRADTRSSPPSEKAAAQPMTARAPATKVAILGAGRGGTALLDLLHQLPSIEIVGIVDRDCQAAGLQRARDLQVPVADRAEDLIGNHGVNLIVDVTGDPAMARFIQAHKPPTADMLSGSASRILWELVRHEADLQAELFHAEKLAGIGSFAAGIAHDINNPLQLILGLAENLTDERDIKTIREQARDIIEAVRRTSAICRDLTQYARRSSVRDDTVIGINGRLDEALKIAKYAAYFHDITIVKQYQPGVEVKGNPDELLHALVNLITNAVHAMERGGGTLTLRTEVTEGSVRVRIVDTGCGIPPDALDRIFEPFFTTKEPGRGTGLGLYNVKTIVQKMHGTLAVDSRVNEGATFTLAFPPIQESAP